MQLAAHRVGRNGLHVGRKKMQKILRIFLGRAVSPKAPFCVLVSPGAVGG